MRRLYAYVIVDALVNLLLGAAAFASFVAQQYDWFIVFLVLWQANLVGTLLVIRKRVWGVS